MRPCIALLTLQPTTSIDRPKTGATARKRIFMAALDGAYECVCLDANNFQDFFALLGSGNEGGEGMVAIE